MTVNACFLLLFGLCDVSCHSSWHGHVCCLQGQGEATEARFASRKKPGQSLLTGKFFKERGGGPNQGFDSLSAAPMPLEPHG